MSSASNVTAPVLLFTLVTVSVGVASFFQLAAVLYGSAVNMYVSLVPVTIAMSHFSADVNPVKSLTADTVKVSVIAIAGIIVVFSFQLLSKTGTFPADVPVFLLAAVPRSPGCTAVAHLPAHVLMSDKSLIVSCFPSSAVFKSVWLLSVPDIFPQDILPVVIVFQFVQSYTLSTVFVLSYHSIPIVGLLGAVDAIFMSFITKSHDPSNELLFTVFMLVQLTRDSCFQFKAFCKSVWLDNVHVIFHHTAFTS